MFVFNKNDETVSVEPLNCTFATNDVLLEFSTNADTLTYWFRNPTQPNLKLQIANGKTILDTLDFKLITKEEAIKSKRSTLKPSVINNFKGTQSFDLGKEIKMIFKIF